MARSEDCLTMTLDEAAAYTGIGRHQLVKMQNTDRRFSHYRQRHRTQVSVLYRFQFPFYTPEFYYVKSR